MLGLQPGVRSALATAVAAATGAHCATCAGYIFTLRDLQMCNLTSVHNAYELVCGLQEKGALATAEQTCMCMCCACVCARSTQVVAYIYIAYAIAHKVNVQISMCICIIVQEQVHVHVQGAHTMHNIYTLRDLQMCMCMSKGHSIGGIYIYCGICPSTDIMCAPCLAWKQPRCCDWFRVCSAQTFLHFVLRTFSHDQEMLWRVQPLFFLQFVTKVWTAFFRPHRRSEFRNYSWNNGWLLGAAKQIFILPFKVLQRNKLHFSLKRHDISKIKEKECRKAQLWSERYKSHKYLHISVFLRDDLISDKFHETSRVVMVMTMTMVMTKVMLKVMQGSVV